MSPLKRYIGRFRRPRGWRRVKSALRYIVLPAVVAVVLMVVVRAFVMTHCAVTADREDLGLVTGDRLLVLRPAFDFGHQLSRGDVIAFHPTDSARAVLIDRVTEVEGDSLSIGSYRLSKANIVGRAVCVSYSVIPAAPFYACLRSGRFFLLISD